MTRVAFVVNPRSDGGRTGEDWPRVEKRARRVLGPIDVRLTTRQGDGTRLCREALSAGAGIVVAVGGDGTLGEVAGGFFDDEGRPHPEAIFAFHQRGTGGDFQRSLGERRELGETLLALEATRREPSRCRAIDVGRATFESHEGETRRRVFLNIASFGIGGVFDAMLNASTKPLGGRVATKWTGARALATYAHQGVRLAFDDGPVRAVRVHNVAVANGRFYGGGQRVAPDARLDDGAFDVVVLGDLTLRDKLEYASSIFDGEHVDLRRVDVVRARKVRAEPAPDRRGGSSGTRDEGPVLLDLDGEQPGRLPATFEVLPASLRICVAGAGLAQRCSSRIAQSSPADAAPSERRP